MFVRQVPRGCPQFQRPPHDSKSRQPYVRRTKTGDQKFEEATTAGPMSRGACQGVKLHEDALHRGPAQVIPAVRQAIQAAILMADVTLLEPFRKVFIQMPHDHIGGAISEIRGRRGAILNMPQEGDVTDIEAKTPVAELFGFAGFESLPKNLLPDIVSQIRTRRGPKSGIPKASDFVSE